MSASELVAYVGDENIEAQWLHGSMADAEIKKSVGKITFNTDSGKVMDLLGDPKFRCLILWLPVDKLPDFKKEGGAA